MTDLRCGNCGSVVGEQENGVLVYYHLDKNGEPTCINCNN